MQSWDIAAMTGASNDYSVGTTWLEHDGRYYLIEVLRERLIFPDLKRRVVAEADRHAADAVLIEHTGSGIPLIQDLQHEGPLRPIAITPEGDKVMRMLAPSAKIEAGWRDPPLPFRFGQATYFEYLELASKRSLQRRLENRKTPVE